MTGIRLSANLGYLWNDRPTPEAIGMAASAGFDAVECHWPGERDAKEIVDALRETGLPLASLNTPPSSRGEIGIAAVPGRENEARELIDRAVDLAQRLGARHVHVLAGIAEGSQAEAAFLGNLAHACERAAGSGVAVLIEPINGYDVPGYFLNATAQAVHILGTLDRPNARLLFDCYHVQILEGDVTRRLTRLLPLIGHVQIAGVPDRGEPDRGELDYRHVFRHLAALGYDGHIGAEYRPRAGPEQGLGWMRTLRQAVGSE